MKIFCSTSDRYHHVLPIFFYLYGKYWGDPMTLIGYKKPDIELPDYCTWVSLGVQGKKEDFASDMREVFKWADEPFVWMMEDTFIKRPLNRNNYNLCSRIIELSRNVGRCSLTNNSHREYTVNMGEYDGGIKAAATSKNSDYRLSLQPAIWHPDYLNKHLIDGQSPWMFENQNGTLMEFKEDYFINMKLETPPLISNEGIRRHDLYRYDFTGFAEEDIIHLKNMGYKHNPWTR